MTSPSSAWLGALASLLALSSSQAYAQDRTPQFLQFHSETLKPGTDQDYAKIVEDAARICIQMQCPNAYMVIETINDPKEVWVLNGFASQEQVTQVADVYKQNAVLIGALNDITTRKQPLLASSPSNAIANWLPVLSGGPPWSMSDARFLIITHTRGQPGAMGAVYSADDGSLFEIRPAATLEEAKAKHATGDPNARIFEVKPNWSMPAKEWIAANPAVWGQTAPPKPR